MLIAVANPMGKLEAHSNDHLYAVVPGEVWTLHMITNLLRGMIPLNPIRGIIPSKPKLGAMCHLSLSSRISRVKK